MTSYTNARPGVGLLVVEAARLVYQLDGSRHAVSLWQAVRFLGADEREPGSGGPVRAVLKR